MVGGAQPREIKCESGLERKAALFLLTHAKVADLQEQPPAVEWLDAAGVRHRHTFDFLATLADGRKLAIAVKPKAIAERKRFSEQLAMVASQLPRGFAHSVLLLTDADLPRDLVHNATLLNQARRAADADLDAFMKRLADENPGASIRELVEASGRGGQAFRSIVRLVSYGILKMVDRSRLGYSTHVTPASSSLEEYA